MVTNTLLVDLYNKINTKGVDNVSAIVASALTGEARQLLRFYDSNKSYHKNDKIAYVTDYGDMIIAIALQDIPAGTEFNPMMWEEWNVIREIENLYNDMVVLSWNEPMLRVNKTWYKIKNESLAVAEANQIGNTSDLLIYRNMIISATRPLMDMYTIWGKIESIDGDEYDEPIDADPTLDPEADETTKPANFIMHLAYDKAFNNPVTVNKIENFDNNSLNDGEKTIPTIYLSTLGNNHNKQKLYFYGNNGRKELEYGKVYNYTDRLASTVPKKLDDITNHNVYEVELNANSNLDKYPDDINTKVQFVAYDYFSHHVGEFLRIMSKIPSEVVVKYNNKELNKDSEIEMEQNQTINLNITTNSNYLTTISSSYPNFVTTNNSIRLSNLLPAGEKAVITVAVPDNNDITKRYSGGSSTFNIINKRKRLIVPTGSNVPTVVFNNKNIDINTFNSDTNNINLNTQVKHQNIFHAGEYDLIASIKNQNVAKWNDETFENKEFTVTINPKVINGITVACAVPISNVTSKFTSTAIDNIIYSMLIGKNLVVDTSEYQELGNEDYKFGAFIFANNRPQLVPDSVLVVATVKSNNTIEADVTVLDNSLTTIDVQLCIYMQENSESYNDLNSSSALVYNDFKYIPFATLHITH